MKRFAIILIMLLASIAYADICRDEYDLDDYLVVVVRANQFSTGAAFTAGDTATFDVFEINAGTPNTSEITDGQAMTEDFSGNTGLILGVIQLTTGNGYVVGRDYAVDVVATVDSVAAGISDVFHIRAAPLATASALSTASGYASDAKTAAEKIDTNTELRTLMTGADTPVAKDSTPLTAAEAEAEAIDALESFKLDELNAEAVTTSLATAVHDNSILGYLFAKANVTNYNRTEDSGEGRTDYGDSNWLTAVPPTAAANADAVWDETLTGASHNNATSAGKRLRQVEIAGVIREEEQAQAGAAGTITLNSNASASNDFYNHARIHITGDTGVGQSRSVHDYDGNSRVATVEPDWITNPDATSDYVIYGSAETHVQHMTAGAIDAAAFAADVDAEIAAYILNALTNAYGGAGTYGQAIEDTLADTNELQGDWTDGGRLDVILDAVKAYWDSLTITGGLLEVVPGNI